MNYNHLNNFQNGNSSNKRITIHKVPIQLSPIFLYLCVVSEKMTETYKNAGKVLLSCALSVPKRIISNEKVI
jgi:hypothetical protein